MDSSSKRGKKDVKTAESWIEDFSNLEDSRVDRNKKHELIGVTALCAMAGGDESVETRADGG